MIKRIALFGVLAIATSFFASQPAGAAVNRINGCINISNPGVYVLTRVIQVNNLIGSCIDINADFVTVNFNFFGIGGPGGGIGVNMNSHQGIVLRNGIITNFSTGIIGAPKCRVEGMRVVDNLGPGIIAAPQCVVRDNLVSNNGGTGVNATANSMVIDNIISENAGDGLILGLNASAMQNKISDNGLDGINALSNGTLIMGNTVTSNGDNGIDVRCRANVLNNVVQGNTNTDLALGGVVAQCVTDHNAVQSQTP
jgi:hypothetical protein